MKKFISPLIALMVLASCGESKEKDPTTPNPSEEALTVCMCAEAGQKTPDDEELMKKCEELAKDMGKKQLMVELKKCGEAWGMSKDEAMGDVMDAAQDQMETAMEAASKEWDAAQEYAQEEMDKAMEEAQKEVEAAMKEAQGLLDAIDY